MNLPRWATALLVYALAAASLAAGDLVQRVELAEDWQSVAIVAPDGAVQFTFSIEAWRAWAADHLEAALGGPVTIGDAELPPSTFHGFGFAGVAPDGRVLLAATTYAMATTASVLTLLDPATRELEVVSDVAYGDVEEVAWSPDGRFVAFTLGTARASGDGLLVDDVVERRRELELNGQQALASDAGLGTVVDAFEWFPGFRDLAWGSDGTLAFVTHDPAVGAEEGVLRWRYDPATGDLRVD